MAELIVALDFYAPGHALELAREILPHTRWFKVGLQLFVSAGPAIIDKLHELDRHVKIFLDLKYYDIPTTAGRAAKAAANLNINMLSIHCQGGYAMCQAVLAGVADTHPRPLIMGVTALTSFSMGEMPGILKEPGQFGLELAELAASWGMNGVVCSPWEATAIKNAAPGLICVCPGIRPTFSAENDQARILTPAQAVAQGADFLVVGRPITEAGEPALAAASIVREMQNK